MISFLIALAAASGAASPAAAEAAGGSLIGCASLTKESTEEHPAFVGFAIFVADTAASGPVDRSLIRDPGGIVGRSGFAKVESGPGWLKLGGKNSLRLVDTGGGIFRAELDSETRWKPDSHITCQIARFDDRERAFAFFDELMAQLNDPST